MNLELSEAERDALQRIVVDWIEDGFTTPPYKTAYYDIFEALELDPQDFSYDIRRPRGTTEEQ